METTKPESRTVEQADFGPLMRSLPDDRKEQLEQLRQAMPQLASIASLAKDRSWITLVFQSGARVNVQRRSNGGWGTTWTKTLPELTDPERQQFVAWLDRATAPAKPARRRSSRARKQAA